MCDFTTMHEFFLAIGPRNRRRLRQIKLEFRAVSQFISFPHELTRASPANFGGGKVLADAIELLARSHRLTTLEIARIPVQVPAINLHASFTLFYKDSALEYAFAC